MATEESDHRQCTHRLVTNEQEPLKGIPKIKIIRLTIDPSVRVLIKDAFQNCRFLTQVVLHKHLTEIGENAFQRCAALETLQIPPSVQVIGKQAFQCCKSLVEVNLSEGLKSVGVRAFESCVKLSISSLPSSVESIGGSAFLNCESIVEFELKMMPRDGHGIEMKLGDNVFQDCYKLQRLAIVSSPTKLVPNTRGLCRGCLTLTDVYLPNGLQEIGASTFVYCKLLRTVSVPMTVKTIRSEAFCSCSSLAEVDLREGLECIESLAFGYCESLSTISLPTSLKVIEDAAFAYCKGLVGVEFGSNMKTRFERRPFSQCSSLVTVSLPLECEPADFTMCMGLRPALNKTSEDKTPDKYHNRFANLPIHAACYYVSNTTVEALEALLDEYDNDDGKLLHDSFRMTPFHILATAGKVRLDLMKILLKRYPLNSLPLRDRTWKTMMDYLMTNRNPQVNPLKALVYERIVGAAMTGWGLQGWKLDVLSHLELVNWARPPSGLTLRNRAFFLSDRRRTLGRIQDSMAAYLKVELTSILELALWKKEGMEWSNGALGEMNGIDRGKCRTTCGADAVIPHVAELLWEANTASKSLIKPLLPCDLDWFTVQRDRR